MAGMLGNRAPIQREDAPLPKLPNTQPAQSPSVAPTLPAGTKTNLTPRAPDLTLADAKPLPPPGITGPVRVAALPAAPPAAVAAPPAAAPWQPIKDALSTAASSPAASILSPSASAPAQTASPAAPVESPAAPAAAPASATATPAASPAAGMLSHTYTGSAAQIADPNYRAQQDAMTPLQRAGFVSSELVNDMLVKGGGETLDDYNARFDEIKSRLSPQLQPLLKRDPVADLPQSKFMGTGDVVGMATGIVRDPATGNYYLQDQRGNFLGGAMTPEHVKQITDPQSGGLRTDQPTINGVVNFMYKPPGPAERAATGGSSGGSPNGAGSPGGSAGGASAGSGVGGSNSGAGTIASGPEGAYTTSLDPNSMTVEGRLQGLLTRGNPLLDMAIAKAMQNSNARGLLNSSMAAEAGEAAVIQNALPIAQQDAQAFTQNLWQNNQYVNQAAQQNKDIGAKKDLTSQQGAIDLQKIAAQGQQSIAQTQAQTGGQMQIDAQRAEADLKLALQKGQIDTSLQLQKSDADALANAARNNMSAYQTYLQAITAINNNKDLDANAKLSAKREIGDSFVGYLRLSGASADANFQSVVDGIFNADAPEGTKTTPESGNNPGGFVGWGRDVAYEGGGAGA